MKRIVIIFVAVLILFSSISAQAKDKKNYFVLKPGVYFFNGDMKDAHHDEGFYGEIVYGRYFGQYFALEGGAGEIHDGVIRGRSDLLVFPVMLTAKGFFLYKNIELFAGGGIDTFFVKIERVLNGTWFRERDNVFGCHVLIGANLDISPKIYIGSEGRYVFTEKSEFRGIKANLNGFAWTLNIGYRF